MNSVISSYPDVVSEALIPMIIAIFALGFPLLIQTISRIDDRFNIYTSIINLNEAENEIIKNEMIKEEAEKENNQVDLLQKVLACVDINVEIQCKQNIKCIQLKAFSLFDDRGKANTLDDVKNCW